MQAVRSQGENDGIGQESTVGTTQGKAIGTVYLKCE